MGCDAHTCCHGVVTYVLITCGIAVEAACFVQLSQCVLSLMEFTARGNAKTCCHRVFMHVMHVSMTRVTLHIVCMCEQEEDIIFTSDQVRMQFYAENNVCRSCSKCHAAAYCSYDCMRLGRADHKAMCKQQQLRNKLAAR